MKPASIIVGGLAALAFCATVALAVAAPPDDQTAAREHWRKHACTEPFAKLSGRLGYLEVKLDLTAAQRPLWDKWRAAVADGAGKVEAVCLKGAAAAPEAHPTIVERLAHTQERVAAEAAGLQAAQPSLAALYQALTPEQRELFEHGLRMGHGGHGHPGWGGGRHRGHEGHDDKGHDGEGHGGEHGHE